MSKLLVIGLSIILITGIFVVPILQIKVQGQVRHSPAPPTPGTIAPPSTTPAPPTPGTIAPRQSTSPPPPSPSPPPTAPETTSITRPPPDFGAAGGGAANQTENGAVNQSTMVVIPQSTMEIIMIQIQDAITAIDSNNKDNATKTLNSVDQELKSAANASGISLETTTTG